MKKLFKNDDDWSFELIEDVCGAIEEIGTKELKLDFYPNQIEIVDFEGMINNNTLIGMPFLYNHWSFGKSFIQTQKQYSAGRTNLAYEMVINSNPCINYLLDNNDMTTQCLVLAHSSVGHNAFFKNNYLFKTFTKADAIINYLKFAKYYIKKCEDKYGELEVENWLDSCHALMNQGVDLHVRRSKTKEERDEDAILAKMNEQKVVDYDILWEYTVPKKKDENSALDIKDDGKLDKPEENILYFIEKNATWLPVWKREIIRIVRKLAQYFYPQGKTKVSNEGFATFTHYEIVNRLYNKKLIDDGTYMQFLALHTGVITQPEYYKKWYSGINPYTLGFNIYRDIKRICTDPTEEDLKYLPHLKGVHWLDAVQDAMRNYSDPAFISQFLSPKVVRDMKLFTIQDIQEEEWVTVTEIQDEEGYNKIRQVISSQYERNWWIPNIQIVGADINNTRTLTLGYNSYNNRKLKEESLEETMSHIENLWEFDVEFA